MLSIQLKLCFSLVLFTTIVNGNDHDQLIEKLNQMACDKHLINDEFQPMENGFIKRGVHSVLFKGEREWDDLKVAMKFTPRTHQNESDREFEMYTYLSAIDNTKVERFGFSTVHYYNEWCDGYMVMVFSRFEENLINTLNKGSLNYTRKQGAVNSLILFRNFVRQSKYMHSVGIRHNNIEPENVMLRSFQSFLIDFKYGSKMSENSDKGTILYASRRCHKIHKDEIHRVRNALDDWESFLYTMSKLLKVQLKWFKFPFHKMDPEDAFKLCGEMKDNITDTIEHIKAAIKSESLLKVFLAFADEAFNDHNVYPNYNHMDELITNEIHRVLNPFGEVAIKPEDSLFTWLNYLEYNEGIKFMKKYSICLEAKKHP